MSYPGRTELVLGRGEVFFDRFNDGARVGVGERYLGNTPSFQITRNVRRAARKSSYRGQIHEEPGHILSEEIDLSIVTDNIAWQNLADWFNAGPFGQQTLPGSELVAFTETFPVVYDRYYQLGLGNTETGTMSVDAISGVRTGNVNAVLREGIEWTLDRERGRIYIIDGAPRVQNGGNITVSYFKRASGVFRAFARVTELYGSIRYIARNQFGPQTDYFFPMVRLTPQGAFDQKGDQFQQIRYSATAMKLTPGTPLLYLIRQGGRPTPVTADTALIRADTTAYTADNGTWE